MVVPPGNRCVERETTMPHQYKIGQSVRLQRDPFTRGEGVYEVVRLMPAAEDQVPQYRIKSSSGQERAAREHELSIL